VAIVNGGGLRAALPAGAMTYGRLFNVIPFDNRQATVVVSGGELKKVIAANLGRSGSIVLLSGMTATAVCDHAGLKIEMRRSDGGTIRETDRLRIATMDFLATGGDDFFASVPNLQIDGDITSTPIVRDGIVDWLRATPRSWSRDELLNEGNRRLKFPGSRPVTCAP
jgi:2',3'-cyclic-nucleotide 2'-phosphodiesterase (5'-nucleotidase family)